MIRRLGDSAVVAVLLAATAFAGCNSNSDSDNDRNDRVATGTFTVTIENLSASYDLLASGVFDTPVGAGAPAPIGPGGAYEFRFGAAPGSFLTFATMFVHSNDLFYAPAGAGIPLFDAGGDPLAGDITGQLILWDAGTELNEEPGIGANQAPRQAGPDTGPVDGNPVVRPVADAYTYPPASSVILATLIPLGGNEFMVRIDNVSDSTTLMPSTGPSLAVPLAPGVFAVHTDPDPIFAPGSADFGEGLEALAEDGDPTALAASLAARTGVTTPLAPGSFAVHTSAARLFTAGQADDGLGLEALAEDGDPGGLDTSLTGAPGVSMSGTFSIPVGSAGPGPLLPGGSYRFTFTATEGDRLSFATMFVQSNDLFFAFGDTGIALFDSRGDPVNGDVTAQVMLWDAGTEANQRPGTGPDQAPRQAGPDTGAADGDTDVRLVSDGFDYDAAGDVVRVTITVE